MSVKNFKFVSPGVFINEIDNSFIPKSADAIGPVVIGRARRGLAMTPVKVQSYSEFVQIFGDTVPGNGGGDISRDGNLQSPMYGTYAAKAFLRSNVAPLTYIRLLGQQDANAAGSAGGSYSSGKAGWKTQTNPAATVAANGGAYGLWVWPSSSNATQLGGDLDKQGVLAAVWYVNASCSLSLSGTMHGKSLTTGGVGMVVGNNTTDYTFTLQVQNSSTSADQVLEKIKFNFDDSSDLFARKRCNTNPQLASVSGRFYPAAARKNYWLGETNEQALRAGCTTASGSYWFASGSDLTSTALHGVLLPIALAGTATTGPQNLQGASTEAKAGWFVGQDLGAAASYTPTATQRLFRLIGRGHGEWLQDNCKVSIQNVRQSTTTVSEYGTFSVVIRNLHDTDSNVQVMERFDNCTLDPASPNFLARVIGDKYSQWDDSARRLKTYGEYPNMSKYVYVDMDTDVEGGATDPTLLPFGYWGPPRFRNLAATSKAVTGQMIFAPSSVVSGTTGTGTDGSALFMGSVVLTGALAWPTPRLRLSASDGGLSVPTDAYWGMQTTRSRTSTTSDPSVADSLRKLWSESVSDPVVNTTSPNAGTATQKGAYVFSLDDVVSGSDGTYYYGSGSRAAGISATSASIADLLNADYNRFTAPFWGGADGFNILRPDPLYNAGIPGAGGSGTGNATNQNSMEYYTYKRAVDTVADPEMLDMNLLAVPGLTQDALTQHMINVCEERADAMALIDLPSIYIPPHEARKTTKKARIGTTPIQAANTLRARRVDSSYGATFYPWVQTRDEETGVLVWVPPSVAMMGVLASSQAKSDLWFAPAGFNRGGLSDGAAGIPVTAVSERLTSKERDTLYEARINPIASFPSSGIVVFGQKTLQERQSALDRINVRRLVIYLKKQISILSTQILFEQNVESTWARFRGLISPFLDNVLTRYGITEYRLILDESTTTADLIDQNVLYAKIMVKPARAIEYIAIDFVIASTGASFDD